MKLIERLIEEGGSDSGSRNFVGPKISENVVRLIGRHFPSYVESDSSKKKKKNIAKMCETQRNVYPSEQEEDERGPMLTSAIKDPLKKWEAVRAMVLEWHPNQANVSRVGDLYNDNAINYFRKILKKREKQSTLDMFFNAP
ncbi:uncharacterized protein TNCV_3246091 [Trichonephila clavipes]|nr:uncharacterized protein TNCV_3246091 [Trichonephila clavipes]